MQIFKTNIVKLAYITALTLVRSASVLGLIKACVLPIEEIRGELLKKRDNVNYWMQITPQKCYLEKALNDTFDNDHRRIYLSNTSGLDLQLIHTDAAALPVLIDPDGGEKMMLIHPDAAYSGGGTNFIVHLNGVELNEFKMAQLRSIIDNNKLADKSYEIYT